MLIFSPLRTKRISIKMRELSITDAIKLALVPAEMFEASTTEFLGMAIEKSEQVGANRVTDPRLWTVQERMLAVCHYLAHVSDDGANFAVSDNANFLDYVMPSKDVGAYPIPVGNVGGDEWEMSPLIGAAAEAIESLQGDVVGIMGKLHWMVGAMAAQLSIIGSDAGPAPTDYAAYVEWLKSRMEVFSRYPESQFVDLLGRFMDGSDKLAHFFALDFAADGMVAIPQPKEGSEAEALPPARFPVDSCISEFSKRLSGKPAQSGG